jgi:hypothetical protein
MAGYSTASPPQLLIAPLSGTGPAIWTYTSVDNATTVDAPGYFTNAAALGIKAGDFIYVLDSDASPPLTTFHRAVSYSGTTLTISTGDTANTGTSGS